MNPSLLVCVFAVITVSAVPVKHTPPPADIEKLNKNPPTLGPHHKKTIPPLEYDVTRRHHHSHGTKSPSHSSSSSAPLELFHITDSPKELAEKFPPVRTSGTRRPPAVDLIGHFPTSPEPHAQKHFTKNELYGAITWNPIKITWKPVELSAVSKKPHITHPPKEELRRTFAPGAFTIKHDIPPLNKKTFAPLFLSVSKKPHGTNSPPKEDLSHHGGVTFPHGAFTYKITLPPIGRHSFAPVELSASDIVTKKDKGSFVTKSPPNLYLNGASKKPHFTHPPPQ